MKLYHGTTNENLEKIKNEGCLWGKREVPGYNISRRTYFAIDKVEAAQYGDVVLEIDFDKDKDIPNNYSEECWQVRLYSPIPIERIREV